ncbi:GAF and ANTAR domain-containing protein [Oceanitalea stevensii]|uniref:GAF and ANTAR domain-containing protein n=1 Tax=Oceanitalea stevensii TaxID=2763072 RepID=A0ABR8Z4C8_9MICO|nr:GAF and ANTAR domain-containing protein [Oceanitalea stevensii]MBD8062863.1 GAF and ANTAR domain-containing protein [Oceanitalea stevensii]
MRLDEELGPVMARASGLLLSGRVVDAVLPLLTATALHVVPAAVGSGITLLGADGSVTTTAGTDPLVERADALQYELDEGPCLDAWHQRRYIVADDLTAEERWPRWAPLAAELGLRSVASAGLVAGEASVGAIKLYSTEPAAFDEADRSALVLFAAQAALLVNGARTSERAGHLREDVQAALRERDTVTRATGLIMGREKVPEDRAFSYLMSRAQSEGTPLHEAAARLLRSASTGT